jgi:hypothetical protein
VNQRVVIDGSVREKCRKSSDNLHVDAAGNA